ncbi:baseplate J/gp47 family protein [Pseudoflavonifractor phocaeensis]|uniref:baseplate J/gp47 family protein n=1 Tax=Pseudoflavonifractor phocaeensis TaxID=1870988 RepID=UPI00313BB02D
MYEDITYEGLLRRMLAAATALDRNIDTREGSMVWYGDAPAAVELRNLYIALDTVLSETYADTASRPYLIKRAGERGVVPRPATRSVCRGEFAPASLDMPIGARFSGGGLNFTVTERIEAGIYKLECETEGEAGNGYTGTLLPIEYVSGLETARLTEILIPARDEEDTEKLRERYFASLDAQAFGGNVADYLDKVGGLAGVGGLKVYREWNGGGKPADLVPPAGLVAWLAGLTGVPAEINAWLDAVSKAAHDGLLTVGGAVRLVLIDDRYTAPSDELIRQVQEAVDPETAHAEGLGLAPIGHFVTVRGVESVPVNIAATLTYQDGWDWEAVRPYAEAAVEGYLLELSKTWAGSEEPLVVRVSGVDTNLLSCPGVVDVSGTTLNDSAKNLALGSDQIPVRGEISG